MTELRATYRLQLGERLRLRARRASWCPTCATSASRTCTCRRRSRRARAPRTATTSSIPARSRASWAARRSSSRWSRPRARPGWASCSTSSRTTWRPTTRTASGRTARCGRSSSTSTRRPAATGASSTSTTSPRCARRTRRCSRRRTSWRCGWCARGVVDGLRIDHPDGLADPAGYLERLRDGGVEHVWVEKILDPGEHAARLAGRRHRRLRVPQRRLRAVRRPRGRGAADRPVGRGLGRRPALRRARRSRPSSSRRGRRSRRRSSGCCARRRSGWPGWSARWRRSPSTAPTSSRGRGSVADEDREAVAEAGLPALAGGAAAARGAGLGGVRHALPADDAAGDGQGRRGHGVLPLRAAAGFERRRRRPGPLLGVGRRLPRAATAERAERFPRNLLVTQTHDTKRSGDVRARIGALAGDAGRVRGARPHVALGLPLADVRRRARRRSSSCSSSRRCWACGRSPRSASQAYLEKAMREAKQHTTWIEPNEEHEAAVQSLRARPAHPPRLPARLRALPARRSPRRATAPRSASCCSS